MFPVYLAALLAMTASPANPSDAPIEVVGKGDPRTRKVCVSSVPTGSILPTRVCKTAVQWEAEIASGKRTMDRILWQQLYQQVYRFRQQRPQ